jgi:hypothetical protein
MAAQPSEREVSALKKSRRETNGDSREIEKDSRVQDPTVDREDC